MKIAILGYGTVGQGVARVLTENADIIEENAGEKIEVRRILDLREFPNDPFADKVTHDFGDILKDREIGIVVETMGGLEPAGSFTSRLLSSGRSVVTSNKELVASHGAEFLELAAANNANYMFEASVGGGIPIIRTLRDSLVADNITGIEGILNGTTNYMLTAMRDENTDYAAALKKAQELGYAERDPSADVEGWDCCRKIAILTSLVLGKQVDYRDVSTKGITGVETADFKYAAAFGADIKLLGVSKTNSRGTCAFVAPVMVSGKSIFCSVNDVYNAVLFKGNMLGNVTLCGKGAGMLPTASAVVSDVIDETRNYGKHVPVKWSREKAELLDLGTYKSRFFIRALGSADEEGLKARLIFGDIQFADPKDIYGEYGFLTPGMTVEDVAGRCQKLDGYISWMFYEG
ncbi:MAG: homoserine dehydrogenase [Lachnospiraceae bacterium]|nr:homoserine dehydrogenase [Lachnospiraceae bacterium]